MSIESLRKPDIQRLLAAFKGEIPDRVPWFEIVVEDKLVKEILGRDVGSTLAGSRGHIDTNYFAPPMNPYDYIEIANFMGQDAIGFEAMFTPFKYLDEHGKMHMIDDGRINSWEDYDKAIKYDWEMDLKPRYEYMKMYQKAVEGTGIGTFVLTGCLLQYCYNFICDFSEFFVMCYTQRDLVERLLDDCVEYCLKIVEMAIDCGISFLYLGDDVAYKAGTFMNPELFKELWFPRIKKLIAPAKQAGIPVMFHSCGNLQEIMDSVIMEMNIDCLNPIEPYSNDIYAYKEKYGKKLTLSGNVDVAGPLAFGTPEEARADIIEHIERLKQGGRYVFASSHSIMNDIPWENFLVMKEEILTRGAY